MEDYEAKWIYVKTAKWFFTWFELRCYSFIPFQKKNDIPLFPLRTFEIYKTNNSCEVFRGDF